MFGREREKDDKINLANCTITTIVGSDTVVEGTIITKSSVRIDGTLVGGVSAEGVVILSKNGKIRGNIMAENIIVAGVVEGNMQIREKTNVEPTGEIYGDITTKKLLIDEESIFQGNCYMNRDVKQAGKGRKADVAENIQFEEEHVQEAPAAETAAGKKNLKKDTVKPAGKQGAAKAAPQEAAEEKETAGPELPKFIEAIPLPKTVEEEPDAEDIDDMLEETAEEDDDMDFLDVDIKKNRNAAIDNKRRRR